MLSAFRPSVSTRCLGTPPASFFRSRSPSARTTCDQRSEAVRHLRQRRRPCRLPSPLPRSLHLHVCTRARGERVDGRAGVDGSRGRAEPSRTRFSISLIPLPLQGGISSILQWVQSSITRGAARCVALRTRRAARCVASREVHSQSCIGHR